MLKITILFCLIFVSVALGAPQKKEPLDIPAPVAKTIVEAAQGCWRGIEGIDLTELFTMVREGTWNDDPGYKKLIGCAFIASGFATSDGKVLVDKAVALFDKAEAKNAIIECAKENGSTPEEKLYNFYKCYQLQSPYTINLSE